MYPTPDRPAFGTFVRDQVEDLRRAGIEVDVFFIDARKRLWNYIWSVFGFWGQLLRRRYDLIHAHYTEAGVVARLQFLYPIILTHHGSDVLRETRLIMTLSRVLHPFFTRVIVVSPQMQAIFKDDRTVTIPCAVNLETIKPIPLPEARQMLDLPLDKLLVLFAGQPHQAVKRFKLLEQAMEIVKNSCSEAELVVVSGQPHSVVPLYMSACDVLALTSISEGSPMVIKEAMACNLPIVSVDVGDVVEVIEGVEGCYIAESTAEDIAHKILLALAQRQRTCGRDKIAHLGSGPITQRIISLYNEVCQPVR
jgi:glycosyltransferase involved in cell wall biosynthesis